MRPSFDVYFLGIARAVALRGTCPRLRVGAVCVRKNRLLSAGYNGAPCGDAHCDDIGCAIGATGGCIRTRHAEVHALETSRLSRDYSGTLYVTHSPCARCLEYMVHFGIRRVVFAEAYRIDNAALAAEFGIAWDHVEVPA